MTPGYWYNKRWRRKHPALRHRGKAKNYRLGAAHLTLWERETHRLWDTLDDAAVLAHRISDRALAVQLRRSVGAVQTRRCRLKKLSLVEQVPLT